MFVIGRYFCGSIAITDHCRYADEALFHLKSDFNGIGCIPHRKGFGAQYFCEECISNICWKGNGKVAVNARLLDGVDVLKFQSTFFDGKNLL